MVGVVAWKKSLGVEGVIIEGGKKRRNKCSYSRSQTVLQ